MEEILADTQILVFNLLRSFIVTQFDLAIVNRLRGRENSFRVFERKKKMPLKR